MFSLLLRSCLDRMCARIEMKCQLTRYYELCVLILTLLTSISLLLPPLPTASLETFKRIEFSEEFIEDACCCSCFYNKCDIKSQQVNSDRKYSYQEVEMAVVVEIEFARDNSITFVFASLNLMYYANQIITVGRRGKFNFIEIAWRLFP